MGSPLLQAAKENQSIHLRNLLLDGADPETRDEFGETALTWAAQLGHTAVVKDLLAAGADIEARGRLFQAPALLLAARGGFRGIVALLAVQGDLAARDLHGATALMRAIERPDNLIKPPRKILAILKLLLDLGADPNLQDNDGFTALMWAVHWGNAEAVRLLVANGADLHTASSDGTTALSLADSEGDTEMVRLLHELGAVR